MSDILIGAVCALACTAMGFTLVVLLVRYFVRPFRSDVLAALCPPASEIRRKIRRASARETAAAVVPAFFVSRLFIWVIGLFSAFGAGAAKLYAANPLAMWLKWDALHYVGLAENWYAAEGDAMYHLVFFPLYPALVRGVHFVTGMDCAWAGTLVSNGCLLVSAWAMYRLVETERGREQGRRAVLLLLFTPLSFFFSIPYSESLFLMLTLLAVLCARRGHIFPAAALGALSAATRLLGLLSAVPIYYECLKAVKRQKGGVGMAAGYFFAVLPVALGFAAYLNLNYRVSGNPLMFLTYQKEHWSQQMGSLSNTLTYTLRNAFTYDSLPLRLGTWIPQAAAILLVIALLTSLFRTVNPGDGAYALLYIYFAVSPTWLLSGARYLTAMYALYPMLALRFPTKCMFFVLMGLSAAGLFFAVNLYLAASGIM